MKQLRWNKQETYDESRCIARDGVECAWEGEEVYDENLGGYIISSKSERADVKDQRK